MDKTVKFDIIKSRASYGALNDENDPLYTRWDNDEHDLILLRHEHLEQGLMEKLGPPYEEAHRLAERKYNYREALEVFKKGEV